MIETTMKRSLTTLVVVLAAMLATACGGGSGTRDQIRIVGSSTVFPFAKRVSELLAQSNADIPSPLVESTGSGAGFQLFCQGLGADTPDIVNASRRIKPAELETCLRNGVTEITEIQVGMDGLAIASAQGGITMDLSPALLYRAIAERPFGEEQTAERWSDLDPSLPDDPILIYGPPSTSGTRDSLEELVMIPGCETDPAMVALKERDEDAFDAICTGVRNDGTYVDQGEQDNLIVQKIENNPRAIGVFGYSFLEENADAVQGLPMNGVEPTYENISSFDYPGARALYIYVKKAHVGAIKGLERYLETWVQNWDRGGALARIGLVASPDEVKARNAAAVREMPVLTAEDLA